MRTCVRACVRTHRHFSLGRAALPCAGVRVAGADGGAGGNEEGGEAGRASDGSVRTSLEHVDGGFAPLADDSQLALAGSGGSTQTRAGGAAGTAGGGAVGTAGTDGTGSVMPLPSRGYG